jgi:5,5'-dehydrodivanillate O-demethylase
MLTKEDNEFLTRVGPGTPAGNLLRRYWHPICPAAELTAAQPKRRVRMLGEDLLLFRDGKGRLGLVAEQCAHRRASLYYGFVEEDGLRCAYHGWKYDVSGQCIEQPFEPAASPLKQEACQRAYPVAQFACMFWTYMGPAPVPLLPHWEPLLRRDGAHRIMILPELACNWLQCMENSVDPVHTYYLHGHMMHMHGMTERAAYFYRPIEAYDFELVKEELWAGVRKVRSFGGEQAETELGHPLIFPCILMAPQRQFLVMHFRVPVDDTHTRIYRRELEPGAASDGSDLDNPPLDYVASFRGEDGEYALTTFNAQDGMAWETQGPVTDRSKELLGASDRGVVMYRRLLKEQIQAVQRGEEPVGVVRDPAKNEAIRIPVSESQGRFARRAMQKAS